MRTSEQSPNGVNGLSTLLVASEQVTPWSISRCAGATPRGTWCSSPRPIRNRSVAGSTVTATPAMGGRLPAHLVEMHPGRIEVEIEVEIDVEIEAAREGEDAGDVRHRI